MKMTLVWTVLALAAAVCAGAAPTAHVRGQDGQWREVQATEENGRVTIRLSPGDAAGAEATVVINKPAWMTLQDDAPPMLLTATLGQEGLHVNGELDLGVTDGALPPLTLRVVDDHNPVNPEGFRVTVSGIHEPAQVTAQAGPPDRLGEFTVQLPRLGPGNYQGELAVADMSPQANVLRIPLRVVVFGAQVPEALAPVILSSGAAEYRLAGTPQLPITIPATGHRMYITGQPPGDFMYPREVTGAELVVDTPDRKVVRVVSEEVGTHDGKPVDEPGRFEFDLEVRSDLPCLLVRSRCFNLTRDGATYVFWGWLGGEGFHTPDGPREWSMEYRDVGTVGWVYLPSQDHGQPGLGWISPLKFGESRFGTMLLHTDPTRIPTQVGEAVEMDFALMPAHSAEEVAEVAARLEELQVWDR